MAKATRKQAIAFMADDFLEMFERRVNRCAWSHKDCLLLLTDLFSGEMCVLELAGCRMMHLPAESLLFLAFSRTMGELGDEPVRSVAICLIPAHLAFSANPTSK